jgi:hypothetical protein
VLAFLTQKMPSRIRTPWRHSLFKRGFNNIANDKRFTFKYLGDFMEAINFTPKELRKTMWTAAVILLVLIFAWRLPEIISVIKWW